MLCRIWDWDFWAWLWNMYMDKVEICHNLSNIYVILTIEKQIYNYPGKNINHLCLSNKIFFFVFFYKYWRCQLNKTSSYFFHVYQKKLFSYSLIDLAFSALFTKYGSQFECSKSPNICQGSHFTEQLLFVATFIAQNR